MPLTPFDLDPETEGSRFTLYPAIVVPGGPYGGADSADQRAHIAGVLGDDALNPLPSLGEPSAVSTGLGRGGEGAAIALQWVSLVALGGVIGGAAWDGVKKSAGGLARLVKRCRERGAQIVVSRGAAALLAVDAVAQLGDMEGVLIEAVEEPTSIAGHRSPEMNYVGIEPWVVFLIDLKDPSRHIVVIAADGTVIGQLRTPLLSSELDNHPDAGRNEP